MLAKLRAFKVVSSFFYLFPAALAAYLGIWPTAFLSFCVALFGMLYHLYDEKRFFWPDCISAWLLIATNLVLCALGSFQMPYFGIAFVFLLLALLYNCVIQYRGSYSRGHGLWHLFGALVTIFSILTFVL